VETNKHIPRTQSDDLCDAPNCRCTILTIVTLSAVAYLFLAVATPHIPSRKRTIAGAGVTIDRTFEVALELFI